MPCQTCAHFFPGTRDPARGLCRLRSDSTGAPFEIPAHDLCEFFELDVTGLDDVQMVVCRHCGAVAVVDGEIELCESCREEFSLAQFFREEGGDALAVVRFNCSRPFRERWLKRRLEVKQGGKSG
jgi:hypothetical protein